MNWILVIGLVLIMIYLVADFIIWAFNLDIDLSWAEDMDDHWR